MTPEQETLENVLATTFREVSTAARLADMAGLDVVQVDRTGSVADVWHSIIGMAVQDGVLGALVDRARSERPRNKELTEAWNEYLAAQPPARRRMRNPPQGQAGDDLSDYRNDERRDARLDQFQRDLAAQGAQIADQNAQLRAMAKQIDVLTELVRKQSEHEAPSLSNTQFAAIMLAFGVLAIIVFSTVYYGGSR